ARRGAGGGAGVRGRRGAVDLGAAGLGGEAAWGGREPGGVRAGLLPGARPRRGGGGGRRAGGGGPARGGGEVAERGGEGTVGGRGARRGGAAGSGARGPGGDAGAGGVPGQAPGGGAPGVRRDGRARLADRQRGDREHDPAGGEPAPQGQRPDVAGGERRGNDP